MKSKLSCWLGLLSLCWVCSAAGQAPAAGTELTPALIESRIEALAADSSLSEQQRERAVAVYREALTLLEAAAADRAEADRLARLRDQGPAEARALRQQLDELVDAGERPAEGLPAADASLDELERQLGAVRAEVEQRRTELNELEQSEQAQAARRPALEAELAQIVQPERPDVELQPGPAAVGDAAQVLRLAGQQARAARLERLRQEQTSGEARAALLSARLALARQRLAQAELRLEQLLTQINDRRAAAAVVRQQAARAGDRIGDADGLAAENLRLSKQFSELAVNSAAVSARQGQAAARLRKLQRDYRSVRQQLEIAGLSEALGPLLLDQRHQLPALREFQAASRDLNEQLVDARLRQFRLLEQRQENGANLSRAAAGGGQVAVLAADQLRLYDELEAGYRDYIAQLQNLQQTEQELRRTAADYAALLDESLFWIADSEALSPAWLNELATAVLRLLSDPRWPRLVAALADSLPQQWPLLVAVAIAVVALVALGVNAKRRLRAMVADIGKVSRDRFALTTEALLLTLLLALPWPLLIGAGGWLLLQADGAELTRPLAAALIGAALVAGVVSLLRQLCRRQGLAAVHLRWPESACRLLRLNLSWFFTLALPCAFVVALTEQPGMENYRGSLGRLGFAVGSIALALLLARLLRPNGGCLQSFLDQHRGLLWRARRLWYPLLVVLPLAVTGLALAGYYFTALRLQSLVFYSACLLLGAAVLVGLVLRWLRIEQRRVAWARARARREAMLAARSKGATAGSEVVPEVVESEIVDLETISDQTRGLVKLAAVSATLLCLWLIWDDLLPALTLLDDVVLWHQAASENDPGGVPAAVTLGSAAAALLLLGVSLFVARNLPGLVEIAVLTRFSMDAGNRYAVITILRYIITLFGIVVALNIIGFGWEKAQWLVAALGVGLGFGLQEIFANFVSGLIILLERPVRVGDTVTLGQLSGTVTRIRIRATSITDWDRKEIIVPNKTFITEALTNWTLTDPITRLVIPVGVDYRADPKQVSELLLAAVNKHPLVLAEPAPAALLLAFGDSALQFEVRVFVHELADRLPLQHELHSNILRLLREQGIEIPFPQRTVHLPPGGNLSAGGDG